MKILITGASKGIGKFLLQKYIEKGVDVAGTYNSSTPDSSLANYMSKVDVAKEEQVRTWVEENSRDESEIVLVNCAGRNYNAFAHKSDLDSWRKVIDVNLIGTFNAIKNVLPIMRANNYGRIINFSSIVAQKGIPGTSAYSASKSALWGMTKSIAIENATKGITINNLNLGYFDIGMITDVPEEYLKIIKRQIPKQELGDPMNIYKAVEFLIESDYTTGTSIDINAGLY